MLRLSNVCKDTLARAYYGLPLYGNGEDHQMHKARTLTIKACRRKLWITQEGKITGEGIRCLIEGCKRQ